MSADDKFRTKYQYYVYSPKIKKFFSIFDNLYRLNDEDINVTPIFNYEEAENIRNLANIIHKNLKFVVVTKRTEYDFDSYIANDKQFLLETKNNFKFIFKILKSKLINGENYDFKVKRLLMRPKKIMVLCFFVNWDFSFYEHIEKHIKQYFDTKPSRISVDSNMSYQKWGFFKEPQTPTHVAWLCFFLDHIDYDFVIFKLLADVSFELVIVDLEKHEVINP